MAYGTPADPVAGTVITVAYAVSDILDPIRWLRLLTGNADPPGSSYVVVSTSTTGTSWQRIGTDALADLGVTTAKIADLGVTTAKIADLNVTAGKLSAGVGTSGYLLQMAGPALGWVNPASLTVSAATNATNATNAGNADTVDGAHASASLAAGVVPITDAFGRVPDSQLLDAHDGVYYLDRSNHTGTQIASTISNFAATVAGLAAATAGDAGLLDGLDSTEFVRKFSPGAINTQTIYGGSTADVIIGNFSGGPGLKVDGNLVVTGTKPREATGHDGSKALLYAFETPEPLFMDVGRAHLRDGMVTVNIPSDFANYVDLSDYYVLLTAEGPGRVYADPSEHTPGSFTVHAYPGDPDISFVWHLIARQGDMSHIERNLPVLQ